MSKRRASTSLSTADRTSAGQFAPGKSGNPAGRRPNPRTKQRVDDWQNPHTGVGIFGKDKRVGTQFNLHQLSFDQLKDLWLGDDLASRAVETIPREALRQGYDVVISSSQGSGSQSRGGMDSSELAAEVSQKLTLLGTDDYLEVVGAYERGYGGSALLIGANDGQEDMTKPLNLQRVRSIDWITPLEARELMPLYAYADPRAPKYGQPEIYQLTSRSVLPSYSGNYQSASMLIHESRLIPFPGIRVSRYQVTTARGGWGESVLNRLYRILRDFNQAWSSAGVLVTDFAQSVIKIQGLWEALAMDGNQAFANRLAAMEYGRSVVNALTIDAGDDYSRQQTPLTGLPDLLEKFAVRLAAACDMPLTLLFGTSPAGMNATGESDVRFFYDRVAAYQRRKLEPALRRLCQVIFRTVGSKREPDKWSIKFRPLWQDSAKDRAAAMFTQAQADNIWINAGVLSPEEVAASHWAKGEYDPNLTVDFDSREAQEAAAAAPVTTEDQRAMSPDDYVPPPGPGTAAPPQQVPPPGEPSAPDPGTQPTSTVQLEDSADAVRARQDGDAARDAVLAQLSEDYPDDQLDWVREADWRGPIDVPLGAVDAANRRGWTATRDDERVQKFMKKIARGKVKPIVLVARPGKPKMMIADGHHRFLASERLDRPVRAYVARVRAVSGPWDEFHDSQQRHDAATRGTTIHDSDAIPIATRTVGGLEVAVEVPAGCVRETGYAGPVVAPCDYGYVVGARGADGDSLDAMVGPNPDSERVFVIQQMLPREAGPWVYFQDKVMLGFDDLASACTAFVAMHGGDARYEGPAREITLADLVSSVTAARDAGGNMSEQPSRADERDERQRFAGAGYGMPSPNQTVARGGHERMADEHARQVAVSAEKARGLHAKAEAHAKNGDWIKFGEASRRAVEHQARAAQSMAKVTYHAERAGTIRARELAAGAARELGRRDAWSEEAREAALEARRQGASQKAATAAGHATAAKQLSEKAKKSGEAGDHRKAAQAHEQAAKTYQQAGQKYAKQAGEHEQAAGEHRAATGERHEPVAPTPDREHGPVPPPKGEHGAKPAEGKPVEGKGHGGGEGHGKEKGEGHGKHGKEHGKEKKGGKVKGALEFARGAAEIVGGKAAGAAAEGVAPEVEGGEGGEE
jgi:phage-related protein (TIGR01555 family)